MTLPHEFRQRLDAKRRAFEEARRALENAQKAVATRREKLATLQIELRAFEEAAGLIESPNQAIANPTNSGAQIDGTASSSTRQRSLSDQWKAILAEMAARYPADVSLEDVATMCAKHGVSSQPNTVRGNMHEHKNRGLVEPSSARGRFRVTAAGAAMAGVELGGGAADSHGGMFESEAATDAMPTAAFKS